MKTQIDALVSGIRHDLAHPAPADPQLATIYYALGLDGTTRARNAVIKIVQTIAYFDGLGVPRLS